jgi:hypothetical protein
MALHEEGEKLMKTIVKTIPLFFAALVLAGMVQGIGQAQDAPEIAPIHPVPGVHTSGRASDPVELSSDVIKQFDGVGIIDRFGDGEIIIGDSFFKVSPDALYFKAPTGRPLLPSDFIPGKTVGYFFEDDQVIVTLWLFE